MRVSSPRRPSLAPVQQLQAALGMGGASGGLPGAGGQWGGMGVSPAMLRRLLPLRAMAHFDP